MTNCSDLDLSWMQRALELAGRSSALVIAREFIHNPQPSSDNYSEM